MTHNDLSNALQEAGLHTDAVIAVTAAEYAARWGRYAALRFAIKRGCPMRLVKLAMALNRDVKEELWS